MAKRPAARPLYEPSARVSFAVIAAAFAAMLALGFRTWGDPVVDVGQRLETARQLALGKVLFRDVATIPSRS